MGFSCAGWAFLWGLVLLVATPLHAATLEGKADVVDGDTIKIGRSVVVRLQGIEAPETLQTCERGGKSYECGKYATKRWRS